MLAFKCKGSGTAFLNPHATEEPARHKLIKMRDAKSLEIPSPIPACDAPITNNPAYLRILSAEGGRDQDVEEIAYVRRVANEREIARFVETIRMSRRARRTCPRALLDASEIVREFQPKGNANFYRDLFCLAFPPRKRALRPIVKTSSAAASSKPRGLLVTVAGAKHVPRRSGYFADRRRVRRDANESVHVGNDAGAAPNCFVKVEFGGRTRTTRTVAGHAPAWKQTMEFPIDPEFSPNSAPSSRESLELSLFDEFDIDFDGMGGYYEDENTIVTQKRFLGHITIPLKTIFAQGVIQGTFRMETPHLRLGHETRTNPPNEGFANNAKQLRGLGPPGSQIANVAGPGTSIKIRIMLHPLSTPSKNIQSIGASKEDEDLLKHATGWMKRVANTNAHTSKRLYDIFAPDVHGFEWLATRFLKRQEPPPDIDSISKCAHFVSHIPFFHNWEAFSGEANMRCTNQQFLGILCGGWEDHATLLANYFMWFSHAHPENCAAEIHLVFATSVPQGKIVFVRQKFDADQRDLFWNAATGVAYSRHDECCPLQCIHYLVSPVNIYANIQREGKPHLMNFDLSDKRAWKPFYSARFPPPSSPLPSMQESTLAYSTTSNDKLAAALEEEIIDAVKSNFRAWRRLPTPFKGDVSHRLRGILNDLERSKSNGETPPDRDAIRSVLGLPERKLALGDALNFCCADVSPILTRLKATAVHAHACPGVEFAMAVRVFPYSNNVLSVWTFLCVIFPVG